MSRYSASRDILYTSPPAPGETRPSATGSEADAEGETEPAPADD